MAAPAPEHVRNIVLVGQDGAGKTSLAEAMLFVSGKTPRMGTTHDGKSYLDYDPEEIKRKFTISTSIAPIPYTTCIIGRTGLSAGWTACASVPARSSISTSGTESCGCCRTAAFTPWIRRGS